MSLSPAAAFGQENREIQGVSISNTESSIGLSWDLVPGAAEYVAYEEIPKPEQDRDELDPVYRGQESSLIYDELGPREVSRIRLLAIDESEQVLARILIRTSTHGADDPTKEINWIAGADGVEIFLGEQNEPVSLLAQEPEQRTQNGPQETVVDESYSDSTEIYYFTTEDEVPSLRTQEMHEDAPESVEQNVVVEVPGFPEPEGRDLQSELEQVQNQILTRTMARTFEWEAFIEDDYIPAPMLCDTALENPGNMYFGGDDRGFSRWSGNTQRLVMSARANFNWPNFIGFPPDDIDFVGWTEPRILPTSKVGATDLYEENQDGSMVLMDSETAPTDELEMNSVAINRTTAEVDFNAASKNPLCSVLGIFDAPAINVHLNINLHSDGSYSYSGLRDGAPNHQAVIDTRRIQTYPSPTYDQFMDAYNNYHTTCVHKHTNIGFPTLALPPIPVSFDNSDHSDPSADGDCSTVDP